MKKLLLILIFVIFLVGCTETPTGKVVEQTEINIYKQSKTKEGAEATAEKFAREWEQKDFSDMYNMFIPDLQKKKSKTDFIALMNYLEPESTITVRLDKISMESDDRAYAYYTVSSSVFDTKAPAMELKYIENAWRVNAFASYFSMDLDEKKYFDWLTKSIQKQTSLINDFNYNVNMYQIEIKYSNRYDKTYCPKFKQNMEDAKKIYDELISLNVPDGFEDFHNTVKIAYENTYKTYEEQYKYCMAKNSEEKETHYKNIVKYWNISTTKTEELQKMFEELQVKYQTDKDKTQKE